MFLTRPIGNDRFFVQIVLKTDANVGAARMYLEDFEDDLLDTLPRSAR
jgi:hypothetical protein